MTYPDNLIHLPTPRGPVASDVRSEALNALVDLIESDWETAEDLAEIIAAGWRPTSGPEAS